MDKLNEIKRALEQPKELRDHQLWASGYNWLKWCVNQIETNRIGAGHHVRKNLDLARENQVLREKIKSLEYRQRMASAIHAEVEQLRKNS